LRLPKSRIAIPHGVNATTARVTHVDSELHLRNYNKLTIHCIEMNKIKLYFLFLGSLWALCCNNEPKESHTTTSFPNRIENDTILHIRDDGLDAAHIAEFKQWNKTQCDKIKKITFEHIDNNVSIPMAFQQFLNVETVYLGYRDWQDTYLPDIFPNLKKIELFLSDLVIDKNARFKKTLMEIRAGKSIIKSIKSFSELPNLRTLNLGYSNFDTFPMDINKLQFLEELYLGAYTGRVDISNLQLSEIKSLKKVFLIGHNKMTGFPSDISAISKSIELEINYDGLTREQKKILLQFKKLSNRTLE
jgi:hypothetical protein